METKARTTVSRMIPCQAFNKLAGNLYKEIDWELEKQMLVGKTDSKHGYGEMRELLDAILDDDIVEIYDAVVDICYVYAGTLFKDGQDIDYVASEVGQQMYMTLKNLCLYFDIEIRKDCFWECWEAVCENNLTKDFSSVKGKVTKGPNFIPVDLKSIINKYHG